jgi:peptidoglycan/LPS O-acetylase OafA/YrhL
VFPRDLHLTLALASLAAMLLVAGEGAVRLVWARPPGRLAAVGSGVVAVLVGGRRPKEWLRLVYALLAFGLVPLADALAAQASPHQRALAELLGALVAAGVIARLFATG